MNARAIRFEVLVNGNRRCIAGIPKYGVLGVCVDWVIRHPDKKPDDYTLEEWIAQRLRLVVGGLEVRGPGDQDATYLYWASEALETGDEITIRVLGPGEFDEPLPDLDDDDDG